MGIKRMIEESFDTDVTLTVYSDDFSKVMVLIESIDKNNSEVETQFNPGNYIVVTRMKYHEYLRFMKRLQEKGRNLSQRTVKGLIHDLV